MDPFAVLLLCGSLVLFSVSGFGGAVDVISASQTLRDGETLNSSGGVFQLGFFSPGRSTGRYLGIWYSNIPVQTIVWVANRSKPVADSSGSLIVNRTGGLVLTSRGNVVVWSASPTGFVQNPVLQLLDNGNLVLRSAADASGGSSSGNFFWQSFDYPTDTFLPEMKLGWDLRTGIKRSFSSWSSPDDPSPGDFTWSLQNIEFPETMARKGGTKYFRSGPWNGLRFSGAPQQSLNPIFWYNFTSNEDEVYYMYHVNNKSMLVRSTLNHSNYMWERSTWSPDSQEWRVFLQLPKDYCDNYGLCGPYGKCSMTNLPYCQCLKGFSPTSLDKWNSNDWSQGCVRNKPLGCPKSKDGFLKYSNIKLPDTTNCSVDATLSLKDCEKKCLINCSCTAYTNSDIRGKGSGCAMWFGELLDLRQYPDAGQDIYIRMPASEIGKELIQPSLIFPQWNRTIA
ncbi:hypothetical protein MLD38_000665 [Melastoma candidum]|uniref:Uncharacterized protein n=1 Tax=Melastoma candidum TaxID=119954 RepID=A0ACB9SCE1_9MYRT|nr:hypothetical protein MLD38_000665 [Melastoma candidum]